PPVSWTGRRVSYLLLARAGGTYGRGARESRIAPGSAFVKIRLGRLAKTRFGSFGENGRRCGSTRWSCTVPCKEQARNRDLRRSSFSAAAGWCFTPPNLKRRPGRA